MKRLSLLLFLLLACAPLYGFEGVVDYAIMSGGREWTMHAEVKPGLLRARISLGDQHYQTILRNPEGVFLVDELNRQIFQIEQERLEWGRKDKTERRNRRDSFTQQGTWEQDGRAGESYRVRANRKDFQIEVFANKGGMPDIFLDQFASLSPVYWVGGELFLAVECLPFRIYDARNPSEPILFIRSMREEIMEDAIFDLPSGYIRGRMKLRMR